MAPASGFVADFTGAVVLTGTAFGGELTRVELDGGGAVTSVDRAEGRVAVSVHPWEIALERSAPDGQASCDRGDVWCAGRRLPTRRPNEAARRVALIFLVSGRRGGNIRYGAGKRR